MKIDMAVLYLLKDELRLSQLTAIFNRARLLSSLERLVNSGKVTCKFDGADYRYRVA